MSKRKMGGPLTTRNHSSLFEVSRREWLKATALSMVGLSTMNLLGCDDTQSSSNDIWWQDGPFAPVLNEIDAQPLMVEGTLPEWLNGTYLRNGPNRVNSDHVLMGDGMVHAVSFESGQPTHFRNRYVQTPRLGQDNWLPPSLRDNPSNIGVLHHHDRLLSLGELGLPFELDRDTLSTIGTYDFGGVLDTAMTGHPKVDARTGELLFFGYSFARPELTFYAVDEEGVVTQQTDIALRKPTLIHDFAVTENYAIFFDAPMFFDRAMALQGAHLPVRWMPESGARIGLVGRTPHDTRVRWFDVDLGFVFHTVSAHDLPNGQVVLNVIRYPDMWNGGTEHFNIESNLWRYVIDPEVGLVSETRVNESLVELPATDPRLVGGPTDETFCLRYAPPSGVSPLAVNDGIVNVNLQDGTETFFASPNGVAFEEPTFIPNPEEGSSGGLLVSFAYFLDSDQTALWAFDPEDISLGPVAKVSLPQRVPFGLHGTFVPQLA